MQSKSSPAARGRGRGGRGRGRSAPRGGNPMSLEEQQRDNQERMRLALMSQGSQSGGLGTGAGGGMPMPTSARSGGRQSASSQGFGSPQQVQQLAAHQMYCGRIFHEKTALEMKQLLPSMHNHEDQTHLLNIMFSVNKQSKRRRATASHAELSSERKYSLKEDELLQALMVHMERKGFTASFAQTVKAGGADKAVPLPQYVAEKTFEQRAQRAANESIVMLLADEDAKAYEDQYTTLQHWVGQSINMYKAELTSVLFPVFVHVFLAIMQDAEEQAHNFFAKHSETFRPQYSPELEKLMTIREQRQLSTLPVAQDYLQSKMTVWICRHTFGLLSACIIDNKLALVLHVLYQHVDLQVFEGNPRSDPREPSGPESLKAAMEVEEQRTLGLWGEPTDARAATRDLRLSEQAGKAGEGDDASKPGDSAGESSAPEAADTGTAKEGDSAKPSEGASGAEVKQEKEQTAATDGADEVAAAAAAGAAAAAAADTAGTAGAESSSTTTESSGAAAPAPGAAGAGTDGTSTEKSDAEAPSTKKRMRLPPIADMSDENYIHTLDFLRRKVRQTDTSLPSTCCYTFRNTHNTLNTLSLERHGCAAVGGFDDGSVRVWDHTNRGNGAKQAESTVLRGHAGAVYGCEFCRDSRFVISTGHDGTARLWSLQRGTALSVYQGHEQAVWTVAAASTGPYFVTGSLDHTARLWTIDRCLCKTVCTEPLRLFAGHLADVDSVAFHPNCNYVATASLDLTIRLWDINSGSCARLMTGHMGPIHCVKCSPCGRYIASAGDDQAVLVWDIASSRVCRVFRGHTKPVHSVDFSSCGRFLASASADGTIKLWSVDTLQPERTESGDVSLSHKGPDVLQQELQSMEAKDPDTCYTTVQFTSRNLLLAAGYVNA